MNKTTLRADLPQNILLDVLKQNQGKWISGEILAKRLSMTRSAIWKKVGILKEEGYDIESIPHRGYRLINIPDLLLVQEIRDGLKTNVLGKREIHRYVSTDSTNNRAKELAAHGAAEGILVIAEEQAHGRGRLDRSWFSPGGENIYVSFILRPSLPPSTASRMVLLTAVAAAEALMETTGLRATLKWPNDILVGGRKIAGILLEMSVEMDAIDYMIVGLGINVNSSAERFPRNSRKKITSVLMETGNRSSRVHLLVRFLELFEERYNALETSGFEPVIARWKTLTDIVGKQATIRTLNGSYQGVITDMDHDGFLIIRDKQGSETRLFSGDITIS
ncbi:MAG: biotin--[acetyl-CoA-carboxylase] ligase [Syntrophaceae bacterium]|nr:biotin--[acetyl-CoA-carboxylase] ligase [Syntrophaceae bacterium]